MREFVTVEVTQADIDKRGNKCPLEWALQDEFPHSIVGLRRWWPHRAGRVDRDGPAPLSAKAQMFVEAFDSGRTVRPGTFRLELPDER